jgi:hypothetical protein
VAVVPAARPSRPTPALRCSCCRMPEITACWLRCGCPCRAAAAVAMTGPCAGRTAATARGRGGAGDGGARGRGGGARPDARRPRAAAGFDRSGGERVAGAGRGGMSGGSSHRSLPGKVAWEEGARGVCGVGCRPCCLAGAESESLVAAWGRPTAGRPREAAAGCGHGAGGTSRQPRSRPAPSGGLADGQSPAFPHRREAHPSMHPLSASARAAELFIPAELLIAASRLPIRRWRRWTP